MLDLGGAVSQPNVADVCNRLSKLTMSHIINQLLRNSAKVYICVQHSIFGRLRGYDSDLLLDLWSALFFLRYPRELAPLALRFESYKELSVRVTLFLCPG